MKGKTKKRQEKTGGALKRRDDNVVRCEVGKNSGFRKNGSWTGGTVGGTGRGGGKQRRERTRRGKSKG